MVSTTDAPGACCALSTVQSNLLAPHLRIALETNIESAHTAAAKRQRSDIQDADEAMVDAPGANAANDRIVVLHAHPHWNVRGFLSQRDWFVSLQQHLPLPAQCRTLYRTSQPCQFTIS
jgi:hypothetical protein